MSKRKMRVVNIKGVFLAFLRYTRPSESEERQFMNDKEKIQNLEKAITEFLVRKELDEFRWITGEERTKEDNFITCLMIDGDAHAFLWEHGGMEEMNQASAKHGCFVVPINCIDIGFYAIAEWRVCS